MQPIQIVLPTFVLLFQLENILIGKLWANRFLRGHCQWNSCIEPRLCGLWEGEPWAETDGLNPRSVIIYVTLG